MISFDIDYDEITALQGELGATEKQLLFACSRALNRTAGTMRRRGQKALKDGLDLRRANTVRRRMRQLKITKKGNLRELRLWFGLNDLPVSDFKGRPTPVEGGVSFRGKTYANAFVAKRSDGKRSIFRRKYGPSRRNPVGRLPIIEETVPIQAQADVILEDEVFADLVDVFMAHLRADLSARVKFDVGEKDYLWRT